ncbi:MAG: methyltransferase domain-containing protein [Desulfobacterales bacterium]|nr:methyltransferase domain-containing protein [Desulfobacterales bacterium]
MVDWSQIVYHRDQIHGRYPAIWDLPIVRRRTRFVQSYLRPGMRMLDVGAWERKMGKKMEGLYPDIAYKSMDVDRNLFHDFYSLDEIDERFDLITFFEVIEHLELEQGIEMLGRLKQLLVDGGLLFISTPNVYNPTRFLLDATHKVAYSYEELGGLLLSQGFKIQKIYRTYNASFLKYFLRRTLFNPLHKIVNVDYARSILIVAAA